VTLADLKDYRCPGTDCRDRASCHRYRTGKGESAPMTAMYVRREIGQNKCDRFIDAQLASETTHLQKIGGNAA
jgi:hypothetical protein